MTGAAVSTSLAERLGGSADDRILIVNCDDLGSSHSANVAILKAFEAGIATSATLMVPCSWAREAAAMFQGCDVGVHLTLTAEYPGYRWRALTATASLHDDDGFMPATVPEVYARADLEDARAECRAQVEQALAWGLDITHLDSHMGTVQIEPRFFEIYLGLAVEFDLPLRMPGKRGDEHLGFQSRRQAAERGVVFTDHFISPWPRDTAQVFRETLADLAPGVSEIYAHPVEDGAELRAYDPDHPDLRANDAICFTDQALAERIDEAGVTLISYRPLRDLQRRASVMDLSKTSGKAGSVLLF